MKRCRGLRRRSRSAPDMQAMVRTPKLINRPFVFTAKGVRLCRPPETVLEIL